MSNKAHTAYHEAGHAVASYRLGADAYDISIAPKNGTLGRVSGEDLTTAVHNAGAADYSSEIVILYAGYAAEKAFFPNASPAGSCGDDEKAEQLLIHIDGHGEELRELTAAIVNENRQAINAIASILIQHEKLSWEEWQAIIDAIDAGEDGEVAFYRTRERMRQIKGAS